MQGRIPPAHTTKDWSIAHILYRLCAIVLYAIVFGATCSLLVSLSTWADMRIHSAYLYWVGLVVALVRTRWSWWVVDVLTGQIASLGIMVHTHQWHRLFYDMREVFLVDLPLSSYLYVLLGLLIITQLYLLGYAAFTKGYQGQRSTTP